VSITETWQWILARLGVDRAARHRREIPTSGMHDDPHDDFGEPMPNAREEW